VGGHIIGHRHKLTSRLHDEAGSSSSRCALVVRLASWLDNLAILSFKQCDNADICEGTTNSYISVTCFICHHSRLAHCALRA